MSITFQDCPGCDCLIPVDDYAMGNLLDRTVHLMHCRYCKVGMMLTIHPDGRTMRMRVKHPDPGYTSFVRLLDEMQRGTAQRRQEQLKLVQKEFRAAARAA